MFDLVKTEKLYILGNMLELTLYYIVTLESIHTILKLQDIL